MMYLRICKHCGKIFYSKSKNARYCSKDCSYLENKERWMEPEQLCWTCKKACKKCSWSKDFIPIKGWDAKVILVKDREGSFYSYQIKGCPEYIKGMV